MSKYHKDWHLLWQIIKRIHIHRYNTKTVSLVMMQLCLKKTLHWGEKHTPGVFTLDLEWQRWQIQLFLIYDYNMNIVMALMIFSALPFPKKRAIIISTMNYWVSSILCHFYCHIFITNKTSTCVLVFIVIKYSMVLSVILPLVIILMVLLVSFFT